MTAPTREQSVLGWAIHCDLIDSRDIDQELVKSILEKLREFSDLAYAAGQAAEREACLADCQAVKSYAQIALPHMNYFDGRDAGIRDCERRIRARGKHE